jgi:competence protein ComEC
VAGLATGPFAIQHFNRVASYGLVANLLVAPLSSFVMMPPLAVGAILEPFGLGGPFLALAGWGIDAMTGIAARVATLPGAVAVIPSAPAAALPVSFLGILVLCLWRGRLRLVGLPLACAVLVWPRPPAPDLWIAADGAAAAMRDGDGVVLLRPESHRFAADLWARRRGLAEPDVAHVEAVLDEHFTCDRRSCVPKGAEPISGWWGKKPPSAEQLAALCQAEVVVLRSAAPVLPPQCAGRLVLDQAAFARGGSAELWREGGRWRIVWAQALRGTRPWSTSP